MTTSQTPELRPLTEEERAGLLERCPPVEPKAHWVAGVLAAFCFVIALILYSLLTLKVIIFSGLDGDIIGYALLLCGFAAMITAVMLKKRVFDKLGKPRQPNYDNPYAVDFEAGQAAITHYTATGALRLLDLTDEDNICPNYFLDIGGGKLLFLSGEYLAEPANAGAFPCRTFDLIRLPNAGDILRVDCTGAPLDAASIRTMDQVDWELVPKDGEVVKESINALPAQLKLTGNGSDDEARNDKYAISLASLPKTNHPGLRESMRILRSYTIGIVVFALIGAIPLGIVIVNAVKQYTGSIGDLLGTAFPLLFLIVPLLGIPFALKARAKTVACLRLASETLNQVLPANVPITVRYVLTITRGSENSSFDKHWLVEFPAAFARQHRLPKEFEVFPPLGELKKEQSRIDWSHTFKFGEFPNDLLCENADVYIGRAGMVVIATSKGYLVRQVEVEVKA